MMQAGERDELAAESFFVLWRPRFRELFERQLASGPRLVLDQPDLPGAALPEDSLPQIAIAGVSRGRHGGILDRKCLADATELPLMT
jgi:hypothetical protein